MMYKIKQKFMIEYEIDFGEISKEEFKELGFINNKALEEVIDNNLNEVKGDILRSYRCEYENPEVKLPLFIPTLDFSKLKVIFGFSYSHL